MLSRRQFFKLSGAAGVGLALGSRLGPWVPRAFAQAIGPTLDPLPNELKYQQPLVIPPAMPSGGRTKVRGGKNPDYYDIAVRQFKQYILPQYYDDNVTETGLPDTTVWSYGATSNPGTVVQGGSFFYPAFTIEAKWRRPVQVNWINDLVEGGGFLPHLLPIDPTLHWANPIGVRDSRPTDYPLEHEYIQDGRYVGPVPIVTHVHGAHTTEESDGYPEAWWLPKGNWNVAETDPDYGPNRVGRFFDYYNGKYGLWDRTSGAATFTYPNDQRATTLWYHDHTLGMTRANVYAGPAGFYMIRGGPDDAVGGNLPGPAPGVGDDPFGTYYEIPIVIQDRSFNDDGALFYPGTREFFDGFTGPFIPDSPVSPIWNPEFFGNMMVVNGRTWPYLNVERRRYRFRFLNGCNSRFLILKFSDPNVTFWQIGAEGGFLPEPQPLNQLLMAPAERADVIVDFAQASDSEVYLLNFGPDEPFKGFNPDGSLADGQGGALPPADPGSTGQVMQLRVAAGAVNDPSTPPGNLNLPNIQPLGAAEATQYVSLNEEVYEPADVPYAALLGTYDPGTGIPNALMWSENITENPTVGATEEWWINNYTEDAHPIHVHLVQFEVVGRFATDGTTLISGPEPWETGPKDTVIAYPGQITKIKAKFDYPGFYVWHCHIVEHEDNEMMRPYHAGPIPADAPQQ